MADLPIIPCKSEIRGFPCPFHRLTHFKSNNYSGRWLQLQNKQHARRSATVAKKDEKSKKTIGERKRSQPDLVIHGGSAAAGFQRFTAGA